MLAPLSCQNTQEADRPDYRAMYQPINILSLRDGLCFAFFPLFFSSAKADR